MGVYLEQGFKQMKIADNTVVLLHYTLKNKSDELLDSSEGQEPLAYIHGIGELVDGLETALTGKQAGDKLEVNVQAVDGYGEYDQDLVQFVPLTDFGDHAVEVGSQFHADTAVGPRVVTITEVKGDEVIVDANHSLAGEDLHFSVEVLEVRSATKEELEHGHVHGEGGCEH